MNKYAPLRAVFYISFAFVLPLLIIWLIATKDFNNQIITNKNIIIFVPISIFLIATLINVILVKFNILEIKSLNFSIPIGILFLSVILLSLSALTVFWKLLIAIGIVIPMTLIVNIITGKIEDFLENKAKQIKPQNEV
ncbi:MULTISPECIES: MAG3450 family membrane protein [unclassified Mycoplasma]|uniref:MAG3450 family membrane protein n=1 Tax=unclassified Mycoplasma TaxID=2683645 RepID=UPI00216AE2A6|nr:MULTISPECIES: hypothetical protein [unclassified Mycoplasma]MCS4537188.1 hypothetical protein [Mycoplasma sp. CSL7475-4]MCT4469935.1 hypothetical protein [Mycoplasma sp. HS2188]